MFVQRMYKGVADLVDMPIWVVITICLIIFSGYMAFRAARAEMKLEQQYIEKEGQVYMERIERARQKKANPDNEPDGEMKSFG
jgi:hypothetical protein